MKFLNSKLVLIPILLGLSLESPAQQAKSTNDLSFLIGKWEVTRIYSPDTPEERTLEGTLDCKWALDQQFIACTYEINRPDKNRGLDEVFFNFNTIYDQYESLWLSSTWPVKVLMAGDMKREAQGLTINSNAEFLIENGVMEYVKGELTLMGKDLFKRETHIRTSEDTAGKWRHHMTEEAKRIKN